MATKRYLDNIAGKIKEVIATVISAGVANAGEIVALDNTGKLDVTVLPTGVGPSVETVVASEGLAAGDFVNIWNNAGVASARKADASVNSKKAHGFVMAAVISGDPATVYTGDVNDQLSGMTPGATQFLSASTPGGRTDTAPSASGNIVQELGVAASAVNLSFEPQQTIEIA